MVELEELVVDPQKTALVVVDVQNDFCLDEEGCAYYDRQVREGRDDLSPIQDAITNYLLPFIDRIRDEKGHIIYIQSSYEEGQFPDMPKLCLLGTRGWELFRVKPNPDNDREIIIHKDAHNPFNGENSLDDYLQDDGITTLLIAGVTTDNCVSATTYVAFGKGYKPIVLADAVSTAGYKRNTAHIQKLEEFRAHEVIGLVESNNISLRRK